MRTNFRRMTRSQAKKLLQALDFISRNLSHCSETLPPLIPAVNLTIEQYLIGTIPVSLFLFYMMPVPEPTLVQYVVNTPNATPLHTPDQPRVDRSRTPITLWSAKEWPNVCHAFYRLGTVLSTLQCLGYSAKVARRIFRWSS